MVSWVTQLTVAKYGVLLGRYARLVPVSASAHAQAARDSADEPASHLYCYISLSSSPPG